MGSDFVEGLRTWSKIDRKILNIYGGIKMSHAKKERKKKEGGGDSALIG